MKGPHAALARALIPVRADASATSASRVMIATMSTMTTPIVPRLTALPTEMLERFHPGNDALTHEVVGKAVLGILGEQPRW